MNGQLAADLRTELEMLDGVVKKLTERRELINRLLALEPLDADSVINANRAIVTEQHPRNHSRHSDGRRDVIRRLLTEAGREGIAYQALLDAATRETGLPIAKVRQAILNMKHTGTARWNTSAATWHQVRKRKAAKR